jgi:hypothetical protein
MIRINRTGDRPLVDSAAWSHAEAQEALGLYGKLIVTDAREVFEADGSAGNSVHAAQLTVFADEITSIEVVPA